MVSGLATIAGQKNLERPERESGRTKETIVMDQCSLMELLGQASVSEGEGLPPHLGLARPSGVGPRVGASLGGAAGGGGD